MKEFTHIDALYQVARHIKILNESPDLRSIDMPIEFEGTVKLHGCNCGIRFHKEQTYPQSRSRILSPADDHYGFAKFTEAHAETFKIIELCTREQYGVLAEESLTLYGEWMGPGIQKKVAINELPEKQFVIFAAYAEEKYYDQLNFESIPEARIFNIHDAPKFNVSIDFTDRQNFEDVAEKVSHLTKAVEDLCPWANMFKVEGTGEGIVWKPTGKYQGDERFYFKSKGMKHQGGREAKIKVATDPAVLATITSFIEFACSSGRLQQGLDHLKEKSLDLEMKYMGVYLKWIGNDIQRECNLELEDNNLKWKQVAKSVSNVAREFYKDACMRNLL